MLRQLAEEWRYDRGTDGYKSNPHHQASRKGDASINTKAESAEAVAAEDVTLIDVGMSLQGLNEGRCLC